MSSPQDIMEITFNVIYLIYIVAIVTLMSKNMQRVKEEDHRATNRIRWAFVALLIGDLGHVGTRLILFFTGELESNYTLLGIGNLFETIGLLFLFMIYTDAWRIHFKHPKNWLFYTLIAVGIIGLIIILFPQNQWTGLASPYEWVVIRNTTWLIQGVALSILLIRDGRKVNDKKFVRIGIYILLSFFFYMPVVFFGSAVPMLGMLMIGGTIIYMLWQYTSYSRFFKKK